MKKNKTRVTLEVVRERERERRSLKKIDFICSAKNVIENKAKKEVIINRKTKIKGKNAIKKRMEYEFKKLVSKIKIARTSLKNHILSFLRAFESCSMCTNKRKEEKDKYAWENSNKISKSYYEEVYK